MISTNRLKKRDIYLNKLIAFRDTEPVKVLTGIRRCGKSSLLKLMAAHLLETGISKEQILEMNFESFEFSQMSVTELYNYVKDHILPERRMYLFFDELQRIPDWEQAINAFRVDFDCDIYITGSNAYLLSSEYATYLSGRYIEIKVYPLSFSEFLTFFDFRVEESKDVLGNVRKQIVTPDKERYTIEEVFHTYEKYGGMPGIADIGIDQEKILTLQESIYATVVLRDILEREKNRNRQRITDAALLKKIVLFLADSIGSSISVSNIGNILVNEGLLDQSDRKTKPSAHTVQTYVDALLESYFFYDIKRFDIKGKEFLRTLGKYYIVDIGMRNYLLGYRNRDRGHALENIVYFELLLRGYDVAIGKTDTGEVDFVITNANTRKYIQVTESMENKETRDRELAPLRSINDHYEKIVLSMDKEETVYDGIRSLYLVDWLLNE